MQAAYDEYNDHARSSGKSRGHFIVDLCRPGHLTICLRNFQERIRCNDDNWDAQFGELEALTAASADHALYASCMMLPNIEVRLLASSSCDTVQHELRYVTHFKVHVASGEYWTSADIVDCIVSYTVTQLMDIMTDPNSREGVEMLARVCTMPEAFTHSLQQACHCCPCYACCHP